MGPMGQNRGAQGVLSTAGRVRSPPFLPPSLPPSLSSFLSFFLRLYLRHMEVPRLGAESELQLQVAPQPQQHYI